MVSLQCIHQTTTSLFLTIKVAQTEQSFISIMMLDGILGLYSMSLHTRLTLAFITFSLGRKEIIEILLKAGMDPNIFDHNKGEHCWIRTACLDYTNIGQA